VVFQLPKMIRFRKISDVRSPAPAAINSQGTPSDDDCSVLDDGHVATSGTVDVHGIPLDVEHEREGKADVLIHVLKKPIKVKLEGKESIKTHICLFCLKDRVKPSSGKDVWQIGLQVQTHAGNAMKHLTRAHASHPIALAFKRKRVDDAKETISNFTGGTGKVSKQKTLKQRYESATNDMHQVAISKWLIQHGLYYFAMLQPW